MGLGHLAAFLGVSLVVIVTPGQDTALTIRNTLTVGRRGGVLTALGVVSGQVTWALAASAGLSAVLLASRPVFTALRNDTQNGLFSSTLLAYIERAVRKAGYGDKRTL